VLTDKAPPGVVLATASADGGGPRPWLVADGRALPLAEWASDWPFARVGSLTQLVEHWQDHKSGLRALTTQAETRDHIVAHGNNVAALCLQAPIEPRQTFCTIGNYRRQIVQAALDAADGQSEADIYEAVDRRRRTGEPYVCLTSPQRIRAPFGELTIPWGVNTLDWEVEIAVVIGARDVIAGYCVANDLTVRSEVTRADLPALGSDWVRSKGMPGSLPASLHAGHLGGAGLDVIESEPAVPAQLLAHPAVVITPHIAFSSDASLVELRRSAAEEVVRVLRGETPRYPCNNPSTIGVS
jgi:Fumarylacetoacetate (FAA) hydrolase family/D-isomer specific 2-hydroxyacid dehydrogenase, NAD binding domain